MSNGNTPVYPNTTSVGLTKREYFAGLLGQDTDECAYRTLSMASKVKIVGRERPVEPRSDGPVRIEYQVAAFQWELAVCAALRCMAADALLAELEKNP